MAETRKQRTPGEKRSTPSAREKALQQAAEHTEAHAAERVEALAASAEALSPVQKIRVGHEQAEAARLGALAYVPEAMAAASAVHARLEADMDVLARYNLPEHPVFAQMRADALKALKGLQLANEHALQLRFNDGCLTPPNRRGEAEGKYE